MSLLGPNGTGVDSIQQPGTFRVLPGDPNNSYLIHKLEGAVGIVGTQMPPPPRLAIDPTVIAEIRQWIQDGALRQ